MKNNQIGVTARKKTKYAIAQEDFISKTMNELGCGIRKAKGLWMKSKERTAIVLAPLMKMDTSKPTPFESNFRDADDAGSPF